MITLEQIGQKAKEAEPLLRVMNGEKKNQVLLRAAEYLVKDTEFILSATVKEIIGDQAVERLIVNSKKSGKEFKLDVSGVFIAVGQIPKNEIFADVVKLDADGFILAAEDCITSRPGIFAAGDCRTKEVRQLTTAAADGAVAALAACKYIAG